MFCYLNYFRGAFSLIQILSLLSDTLRGGGIVSKGKRRSKCRQTRLTIQSQGQGIAELIKASAHRYSRGRRRKRKESVSACEEKTVVRQHKRIN